MSDLPSEVLPHTTLVSPSRKWRSCLSLLLIIFWVLLCIVFCGLIKLLMPQKQDLFFKRFHRGCCLAFGLRTSIKGEQSTHRPTLFLANHVSYLDVFILGGQIPGYFIAKSEVANWPILGSLAKIQNTLFFERRGMKVQEQLRVMSRHFNQKGNLILFPEGTSTEGEHVEPFKSSLLKSVEMAETDVLIQPVTIAYTHYNGQAMTKDVRDHYAWYATMPFVSHFFSALGMRSADVTLQFHAPVSINHYISRKDCANDCFDKVSKGLSQLIEKSP